MSSVDQDLALRRRFFHRQPPASTPRAINPRTAELGSGTDGDRPEQAVRIVIQPGGEIERVRRTRAATVTEAQGPKFGGGKRLTRVERQRALQILRSSGYRH